MIKFIDKRIDLVEMFFKVMYMLHLVLAFNVYTTQSKYTLPFVLVSAGVILLYRFIKIKKYKQYKNLFILLLFLFSYMLSSVVNVKYGLFENFQCFMWILIQICILYSFSIDKEKEKIYKEFTVLSKLIILAGTIYNSISLVMLFINYSSSTTAIDGSVHIVGLSKWGRLFGIYTDPNYAGIFCVTLILLAIYFFKTDKNKILKVMYGLTIIVQYLYIVFSGSRSALLCLSIGLLVYYILNFCVDNKKKLLNKIIVSSAVIIMIPIVIIGGSKGIINFYNYCKNYNISEIKDSKEIIQNSQNTDLSIKNEIEIPPQNVQVTNEEVKKDEKIIDNKVNLPEISNNETEQINKEDNSVNIVEKIETPEIINNPIQEKITIGREEQINNDISNRRFDIWKSCFEVFKTSPIVGVSFRNLILYSKDILPNTYIVNNDLSDFDAAHNMFFDVIVSQGTLGVVVFISFIIATLCLVFKNIKNTIKNDKNITIILISICTQLLISSMFLSHILYVNNITTFLFWVYFGYLVWFLQNEKHNVNDMK